MYLSLYRLCSTYRREEHLLKMKNPCADCCPAPPPPNIYTQRTFQGFRCLFRSVRTITLFKQLRARHQFSRSTLFHFAGLCYQVVF